MRAGASLTSEAVASLGDKVARERRRALVCAVEMGAQGVVRRHSTGPPSSVAKRPPQRPPPPACARHFHAPDADVRNVSSALQSQGKQLF